MVVIRCTQKLLRRVGPAAQVESVSTTRLGDWYGHLIGVGHQRLALFVSQYGRLPVVLPARGIKAVSRQLPKGLGEVLLRLGVPEDSIKAELAAMMNAVIATTNSRSLLGTINDFRNSLWWSLRENPEWNFVTLALQLSETPIGPMNYESPDRAVRHLLA